MQNANSTFCVGKSLSFNVRKKAQKKVALNVNMCLWSFSEHTSLSDDSFTPWRVGSSEELAELSAFITSPRLSAHTIHVAARTQQAPLSLLF